MASPAPAGGYTTVHKEKQDFKNRSLPLDDELCGHSGNADSDSPVRAWRTLAHSSVFGMMLVPHEDEGETPMGVLQ